MGHGYAACHVIVLSEEYAQTFPEWNELMMHLEGQNDDFAYKISIDAQPDDGDQFWEPSDWAEAVRLYKNFQAAFQRRHPTLEIHFGYHDPEAPSQFDEVCGYFLKVNNYYVVSDEGKKIESHVTECDFVEYI